MVNVFAQSPHVRHYVIDLVVGQQIPEGRHNLREPTGWPSVHDHSLPVAVWLRRSSGAIREIWKRIWSLEHCARLGSTLPVAAVTRNATALIDLLAIFHIRGLRIAQRLCRKKEMPTKKHDHAHYHCARQCLQNPRGESAHARFAAEIQHQPCFCAATPPPMPPGWPPHWPRSCLRLDQAVHPVQLSISPLEEAVAK